MGLATSRTPYSKKSYYANYASSKKTGAGFSRDQNDASSSAFLSQNQQRQTRIANRPSAFQVIDSLNYGTYKAIKTAEPSSKDYENSQIGYINNSDVKSMSETRYGSRPIFTSFDLRETPTFEQKISRVQIPEVLNTNNSAPFAGGRLSKNSMQDPAFLEPAHSSTLPHLATLTSSSNITPALKLNIGSSYTGTRGLAQKSRLIFDETTSHSKEDRQRVAKEEALSGNEATYTAKSCATKGDISKGYVARGDIAKATPTKRASAKASPTRVSSTKGSTTRTSSTREGKTSTKKSKRQIPKIFAILFFPFALVSNLVRKDKYNSSNVSSFAKSNPRTLSAGKTVALVTFAVLIVAVALVYPAARNYYISLRSYDKAQVELAAVEARNSEIEDIIKKLGTNSGMEDYVRSQYGWVKSNENAVLVSGLNKSASDISKLPESVRSGSVVAEDTWWQNILDAVFFVDDDTQVSSEDILNASQETSESSAVGASGAV